MTQQFTQPPHAQMPVQKKKHTVRNVVLGILVVGLLAVGGCTAALVKGAGDVGKSIQDDTAKNAPIDVTAGTAFTRGKHETMAGWKVSKDTTLGGFMIVGKVKNTSDSTSTAYLHFKFLDAKGEVLGNVQCSSSDLEPGQTQALNCIPDGTYAKWAKITAEATF